MKPKLPKDFLWTDKKSMDEFFELDPINEDFYMVISELSGNLIYQRINILKVFNEVYYQATRLVFERPSNEELRDYIAEIKANLGWNYSAQLVLTMIYHLLLLYEDKSERRMINVYTKIIRIWCFKSDFWKPIKHCFEKLRKEGALLHYRFKPCPLPAEEIYWKYGSWNILTANFDMDTVSQILGLWDDYNEKGIIASRIRDSMIVNLDSIESIAKRRQLEDYLRELLKNKKREESNKNKQTFEVYIKNTCIKESDAKSEKLEKENELLKKENAEQQKIIQILKDQIKQKDEVLNSKADKNDGIKRVFSLVEISEYCKRCVGWDDVKSIVAMLNKLLRFDATTEDAKLVDGIETEFRKRLSSGIKVHDAKISVESPGNIIAHQVTNNE